MEPQVFDPLTWFSTVAGIGGAVWATIEVIKRTAADVPGLKKLPIWLYAVLLSGAYTALAHSVLHTLEGELGALIAQAVMTAMVASGGREWALTLVKPLEASARAGGINTRHLSVLLVVLLSGLTVAACSLPLKQRVVIAYQGTEVGLEAFHDAETAIFQAKVLPGLNPNKQDQVLAVLDRLFGAQEKAGAALLLWRPGAPIPEEISGWLREAEHLLPEIAKIEPALAERLKVAKEIIAWARAIVELTELLKVNPPTPIAQLAQQGA